MQVFRRAAVLAAILGLGVAGVSSAVAQAPDAVTPSQGLVAPPLLPIGAPRDAITAWLAQNLAASHGRQVYINGGEAFWIEHQDVDTRNSMKITATIHSENFADPSLTWRSSYQLTQFDCEAQQQYHYYLTKYLGNGLTGEVKKEDPLIKRAVFIPPVSDDFAHIRAVCLPVYDRLRGRTYTVSVPAQ